MQLQVKGHNSECYSFGAFYLKFLSRIMAPGRQALVPHAVLLLTFTSEELFLHVYSCLFHLQSALFIFYRQHHPHRQNLFEVVTLDRTFNIQVIYTCNISTYPAHPHRLNSIYTFDWQTLKDIWDII